MNGQKTVMIFALFALLIGLSAYQNSGIAGAPGTNGTNGINGSNGSNGLNGTNGINQSDSLKVNKSGDNMTGDIRVHKNNHDVGQIGTTDLPAYNISFFTLMANLIYDDTTATYYPNSAYADRASYAFQMVADDGYGLSVVRWGVGNTSSQYTVPFQYNYVNGLELDKNINVKEAGKGITMHSPNGNAFCTTVTNAGSLSTTSGAC